MKSFETRIKKLEEQASPSGESIKVLVINDGETKESAMARLGISEAEEYLQIVFVSPEDVQI
ncbi:MAG: hypothetical protein ACK5XE_10550 [Burkholderiales bacterium]